MPLPLLDPSPVQATFRTALFALILGGGTLLWLLRAGTMVRLIPQGLRAIARDRGRALGHMLAGGVGIGTVGVTVLAVETGGPGALAWIWLAGLVGMAFHRAHFDIAHAPGQASRPGLLPALAGQLGRLGAVIAGLVALASVAVAITLGGAFQAQQGSQLLAATTPIRGLWLGPILAVVIATAVLLRRKTTRTWVSPLALVLVGAYCLGLLALLLGDLEATGQALSA
ncbi:MAG: alanine:cation symporter family protein, partial [Nannocystaceae bacterium]